MSEPRKRLIPISKSFQGIEYLIGKSFQFCLLSISAICDLIAEYTGFHEAHLTYVVFGGSGYFPCSKIIYNQFAYMHYHLAAEKDITKVKAYIFFFAKNIYIDKEKQVEEQLDPAGDENNEIMGVYQEYLFTLLKFSIIYKNTSLHEWLWTLSLLDSRLCDVNLWQARFEGCMEQNDVSLFYHYFDQFMHNDSQSIKKKKVLRQFIYNNYNNLKGIILKQEDIEKRKQFFHSIYDTKRVLPVNKEILLGAIYLNDDKMQRILLRNYEEAKFTLNTNTYSSDLYRNEETWHEAYKLFINNTISEAQNVLNVENWKNKVRKGTKIKGVIKYPSLSK